jgi:hypothetical protein
MCFNEIGSEEVEEVRKWKVSDSVELWYFTPNVLMDVIFADARYVKFDVTLH